MKFMASHEETAIPAAPLYDGKAMDRAGVRQSSPIVFLPVYVLVLMVGFVESRKIPNKHRSIVTRGILNTSIEDS